MTNVVKPGAAAVPGCAVPEDERPVTSTALEAMEASLLQEERIGGIVSTDHLPRFAYFRPTTLAEAIGLLQQYGRKAAVIAGGTDLLRDLKNRSRPVQPEALVSLRRSDPPLNTIEDGESGLAIGSLVTLRAIETSDVVRRTHGILAQAAHQIRSWQYRNAATLGGDLCQREQCWYSRSSGNAYSCFRKGGEDCFAVRGDNRFHAIFGRAFCWAACPSATAPALAAMGAKVQIAGPAGLRTVPVEWFFGPRGTVLEPTEIVTAVQIPSPRPDSRGAYLKVGPRNQFDPALVSVAVVASLDRQTFGAVRIVLGAVSPQPWRAMRAEEVLLGEKLTEVSVARAAEAAVDGSSPLSRNGYKVDLVKALVRRALLRLAE